MKKIIIIGATSGLGKGVAETYIERGYSVGVAGRREERLLELQKLAPDRVFPQVIDVTKKDATKNIDKLIAKMEGVDTFFLSSGIGLENIPLDPEIEIRTAQVNVEGFTRVVTHMFNYFKIKKDGHIAVISSVAGVKGLGGSPAYAATKSFQIKYIDSLAQLCTIEKYKIKLTNILPGFTKTDILPDKKYPFAMSSEKVVKIIVRAIDKKRRYVVADWKFALFTPILKRIPEWIWEKIPLKN